MKPFDRDTETRRHRRNLSHWEQPGCMYFVTWRLADSLPDTLLGQWRAERVKWLDTHPEPWTSEKRKEYHRLFAARIESWLDAGHGSCVLRRGDARQIVADALQHFDGQRYVLEGCVIMPNHVHVLVTPLQRDSESESETGVSPVGPDVPSRRGTGETPVSLLLPPILHSWKSYTAHKINRFLGRNGPL